MEATPGQKPEEAEDVPDIPEVIPFRLGELLRLRSIANPELRGQTVIVGVHQRSAILIEEPGFSREDRLTGRIGGGIICAYFQDGCLYKFKSRFGQILTNEIICIDYPERFEAQQLRHYPRIKVILQALSAIGKEESLIDCNIIDISEGGCCLELPCLISPAVGTPVQITFELPNDEVIENIRCTVMNMRRDEEDKRAFVGLSFLGPASAVLKVKKFCRMCSYFRV